MPAGPPEQAGDPRPLFEPRHRGCYNLDNAGLVIEESAHASPLRAVRWLSLALFLALPGWSPARAADGFRAGAARIDITPDQPVRMSGYAGRTGLCSGVHDPLSARSLAFEAGGRRLVLISTDLIGFYGGTAEVMREALMTEFGLQPAELFLSAIHTHAGPTPTLDQAGGHANNVAYTELRLRGTRDLSGPRQHFD